MGGFDGVINTLDKGADNYADEYPNIGFNPAPGVPSDVESLGTQVQTAANGLAEADKLLTELRSACGTAWQGDAAEAFRSKVNSDLAPSLEHAQQSLTKAVGVLTGWQQTLVANKQQATTLEEQARQARQAQAKADQNLNNAMANPDLGLAGQYFPDQSEYLRAKARYELAAGALQQAETESQGAANTLNAIIAQAKALKDRHFTAALDTAGRLGDCSSGLAPEKPGGLFHDIGHALSGAFHSVTGWVKDHVKQIHDVLSTVSAISGVLALCTPPPADAIFAGVAVVAGAGALGCDLADPNFRKQLLSGNPGAILTAVGDAASVIPGVGAAKAALKEGTTLTEAFSTAGKGAGLVVKGFSKVPAIAKIGEKATGLDRVLQLGYKEAHTFTALDRLNLFYKGKGVLSNVKTDVTDVFN